MDFAALIGSGMSSTRLGLALLAIVALAGACSRTYYAPRQAYARYPARDSKIPLRVGLDITGELRKTKSEPNRREEVLVVGESVATNARVLARHVFTTVVDANAASSSARDVDAILTPAVVYVSRTFGATAVGESIVSIKIEWRLQSPSGRPIWIDTVSGQSAAALVTDPEKVLEKALEDTWRRSEEAFFSSRAIRLFVASRKAAVDGPSNAVATIVSTGATPATASPTSAGISPGAPALVGTWTGTLGRTRPDRRGRTREREMPVEVTIAEEGTGIRWTMTRGKGTGRVQLAGGSASFADDGTAVLVGVFGPEAGRLAGIAVQYQLRVLEHRLDGTRLSAGDEVHELLLTR